MLKITRILFAIVFISSSVTYATPSNNKAKQTVAITKKVEKAGASKVIVNLQTNQGLIVLELNTEKAPITTKNFISYVKDGFYDGTIFHRVIPNFMIQCGGFEPGMKQKTSNESIENEADNGLANDLGTIAMARTMDPHSASSQFFVNTKDNDFLNFSSATPQGWGYAVFGKVVDGMDVIKKIEAVATGSAAGHQDVPTEDVIIEKATLAEEQAEEKAEK